MRVDPAQSGKTLLALLGFGLRLSKSNGELGIMGAEDLNSIIDNLLEGDEKFLEMFGDYARIVDRTIGGKYLSLQTPSGNKKILFAGYGDKSKWKKVLGKPIEISLTDEANIANKDYIDELVARTFSFENPLMIFTTNGSNPDDFIYTDYINYCTDLFPDDTPESTKKDMAEFEKRDGYYYVFWGHWDNPFMTNEKYERIMNSYPKDSFYYLTKVLGVRGRVEGLLYANLIKQHHIINELPDDIMTLEIGVDIGDNALTVFCLTAFTRNFAKAYVIDTHHLNHASYDEIINEFNEWLTPHYQKYNVMIRNVYPDAADSIFVRTLRTRIKYPINVVGSKKATIEERIVITQQLLHQNRLFFMQDAKELANNLKKIASDGKGKWLDENKPENDYQDAFNYSLTPHMKKLSYYNQDKVETVTHGNKALDR